MIRTILMGLAALALAGCASYAPYGARYPVPRSRPMPPAVHNYAYAPSAPLISELFTCSRYGANLGPIGARGESALYTPYIYTDAGPLLRNPTQGACLSSGFGWRGSSSGGGREHTGLDLANAQGGFIFAAAQGRVSDLGLRGGYGYVVELDHGRGVRTLYAHLADINPALSRGTNVQAGQPIGFMGASGNATGVHLHYEVSVDGLRVDPLRFGVASPYQAAAPPYGS